MKIIFSTSGHQLLSRTIITDWLSLPERYTMELDLGHVVMFSELENWWNIIVNRKINNVYENYEGTDIPIVTCSPYFLHLYV